MIIAFKIILFILLLFSGVMALDKQREEEYRLKCTALSISSTVALIISFYLF